MTMKRIVLSEIRFVSVSAKIAALTDTSNENGRNRQRSKKISTLAWMLRVSTIAPNANTTAECFARC
jgi:hypothetical protein